MNKSSSITFRVSDHEKKRITSKSSHAKISISDFCRYAALGKEIKRVDGLDDLNYQIKKIGNNINQIAKQVNIRNFYNPDLEEINANLGVAIDCISKILGGDDHSDN